MLLHEPLADRQAKPAPATMATTLRLDLIETVEEARQVLTPHARPVVDDRDDDFLILRPNLNFGGCAKRGMARHIGQQIVEHLLDPARIGQHWRNRRAAPHGEPVRADPLPALDNAPRQGVEPHRLALQRQRSAGHARRLDQVADQAVKPIAGRSDRLQKLMLRLLVEPSSLLQQERGVPLDVMQRGAQVVGDVGDEFRLELFEGKLFLLRALALRNVDGDAENAIDGAMLIMQRRIPRFERSSTLLHDRPKRFAVECAAYMVRHDRAGTEGVDRLSDAGIRPQA